MDILIYLKIFLIHVFIVVTIKGSPSLELWVRAKGTVIDCD